jgi:hypothetical protein
VPAVEGGAATDRQAVGPRDQARRLPADGAPGWLARPLLHSLENSALYPSIINALGKQIIMRFCPLLTLENPSIIIDFPNEPRLLRSPTRQQ